MARTQASVADLAGVVRRTTGDVPPPLVGASLTVIENTAYVFGGRLVPTRSMVATLYALRLDSLTWAQLWPPADATVRVHEGSGENVEELQDPEGSKVVQGPRARYFHGCDAYGDQLVIFGGSPAGSTGSGEGKAAEPPDQGLCVLNDVVIWNTSTSSWSFPSPPVVAATSPEDSPTSSAHTPVGPSPRYAHLSCIANNCLVILGGQDLQNKYLQEISVLDLERMVWIETRKYDGHCGTYRSVAVSRPLSVHYPDAVAKRKSASSIASGRSAPPDHKRASTTAPELVQLPYSAAPTRENPEPIFLYSNFNFSSVRRALDLIAAPRAPAYNCPVTPLSHLMSTGPALPPGLRFPTGAIVGGHLVVAGTFLSQSMSCFALWALDLANYSRGGKLTWMKLDSGVTLSNGASWNKAIAWRNSVVVLGDRDRNIADDYDHRQTNFVHAAFVNLETFGIYQPPIRLLPPVAQELALSTLALTTLHDFEIICSDGVRVGCSRKMLEERWTWLREQLAAYRDKARGAIEAYRADQGDETTSIADSNGTATEKSQRNAINDVRVTPRTLNLPESSDVARAAVEYFYTQALCTADQKRLAVLAGLLLFARAYNEANLRALVVHALHGHLDTATPASSSTPAVVYEAAALSGALSLQVRALKMLMAAQKAKKADETAARPPDPSSSRPSAEV